MTEPKAFSAHQAARDRRIAIRKLVYDKGFSYAVAERVVDGEWTVEQANGYGIEAAQERVDAAQGEADATAGSGAPGESNGDPGSPSAAGE